MAGIWRRILDRAQWERLSERNKAARHRAMRAIGYMRSEPLSLSQASDLAGTTPETVRRYAGPAVTRQGGTYKASKSDRLYRRMTVQGVDGRVDVDVRGSRQAGLIGAHHNAIGRYLATGDYSYLTPFIGETVDGVELLTDIDRIEQLAAARDLDIDDIYPRT